MNAYWAQWSRTELNDMLGVEERAYHDDDHDDTVMMIGDDEQGDVCCSGCMDCLGMSWRDFF